MGFLNNIFRPNHSNKQETVAPEADTTTRELETAPSTNKQDTGTIYDSEMAEKGRKFLFRIRTGRRDRGYEPPTNSDDGDYNNSSSGDSSNTNSTSGSYSPYEGPTT